MAYGIPKDLETESAVSIHFRVKKHYHIASIVRNHPSSHVFTDI